MGHTYHTCPNKSSSNSLSTTATNTSRHPANRRPDQIPDSTTAVVAEHSTIDDRQSYNFPNIAGSSLFSKTHDSAYYVQVSDVESDDGYVKTFVDSGSGISLMKENTYNELFSKYNFLENVERLNFGGLNKSPLIIHGYIDVQIKVDILPGHNFKVRFAVVPDSTMTYALLLGQNFTQMPGMKIVLEGQSVALNYSPPVIFESLDNGFDVDNEILQIDCFEEPDQINDLVMGLDEDVPFELRLKLFDWLNDYLNNKTKIEPFDYKIKIQLTSNANFQSKPRRMSWAEKKATRDIVKSLQDKGILRASNSSCSSPVVLVRQKNGEYRLCIDYRALNKITVKYPYPLPRMEDQIDQLGKKKWFTSLDLKDGFHHMWLDEETIPLTSFVTCEGQYEFLKLPFGTVNGPAHFARYIFLIFQSLIEEGKLLVYLDDLLIATVDLKEHFEILKQVIDIMKIRGLELNFQKCQFLKKEIEYLGYLIDGNGIRPSKETHRSDSRLSNSKDD